MPANEMNSFSTFVGIVRTVCQLPTMFVGSADFGKVTAFLCGASYALNGCRRQFDAQDSIWTHFCEWLENYYNCEEPGLDRLRKLCSSDEEAIAKLAELFGECVPERPEA